MAVGRQAHEAGRWPAAASAHRALTIKFFLKGMVFCCKRIIDESFLDDPVISFFCLSEECLGLRLTLELLMRQPLIFYLNPNFSLTWLSNFSPTCLAFSSPAASFSSISLGFDM